MKSQDVALLLKLICLKKRESEPWEYTVRGLEESTGISKSQVNSSLNRCVDVGLALKAASDGLMDVNRQALVDFVIHGLRFVFPARLGPPVRGMRTGLTA